MQDACQHSTDERFARAVDLALKDQRVLRFLGEVLQQTRHPVQKMVAIFLLRQKVFEMLIPPSDVARDWLYVRLAIHIERHTAFECARLPRLECDAIEALHATRLETEQIVGCTAPLGGGKPSLVELAVELRPFPDIALALADRVYDVDEPLHSHDPDECIEYLSLSIRAIRVA